MANTTNYNLVKPDGYSNINIDDINANMDIIDEAIKEAKDAAGNIDLSKKYEKPSNGIPKSDLSQPVQASLERADNAATQEVLGELFIQAGQIMTTVNDLTGELTQHKAESATTTKKGHVQLSSSVTSTSETLAATPKAVKTAMDRADAAFTQANDIKTKWVNVVGGPLLSTDTQAQLQTKTQTIKNTLATNLTAKGQTSVGTETMTALVNKVPNINTGKPELNGTVNGLAGNENRTVTGLSFKPSMVELYIYSTDGLLTLWGVLSTGASPIQDIYYDRSYSASAKQLSLHLSITNDGFTLNGAIAAGRPYGFVWRARG